MDYSGWYRDNFQRLSGAGLWLRGAELNRLPPAEYSSRCLRVLFARLSTCFDTSGSFTHQLLYQLAAGTADVFPDLCFLPPRPDARIFDRDSVPWLLGSATKLGPAGFDLLGISNSITLELLNLPVMLAKSGLPLRKSERLIQAGLPLIILGGANALYSTALWNKDPLVDGIFAGESTDSIRRILETCRDAKMAGLSKKETLARLSDIPGFIEPDAPRRTRKAVDSDLSKTEALRTAPASCLEESCGAAQLQISEGCPCFCSFCAEAWERKPYRERRLDDLKRQALDLKAALGLEQIDLYSFNFNQHSDIYALIWEMVPLFRRIGLKSQRFDLLAHDPQMAACLHAIEKSSFTCGLEGISPRLRRYLHKSLADQDVHSSLAAIFKSGVRELKLFLIATGLETSSDFGEYAALLEHISRIRGSCGSRARIIISITPLVRFPWTPLEFADAPLPESCRPVLLQVKALTEQAGFEFRESASLSEYLVSQILVRAAGPAVGESLQQALQSSGFVYYRQLTPEFARAFEDALRSRGLRIEDLLKAPPAGAELPWTLIETGVSRDFLRKEFEAAGRFEDHDYCLGRSWAKSSCLQCEACQSPAQKASILQAERGRSFSAEALKNRVAHYRQSAGTLGLLLDCSPGLSGLPRAYAGAALARALMLTDADLISGYRGYKASYWAGAESACWIHGLDLISLEWLNESLEKLKDLLNSAQFNARVNACLGDLGRLCGAAPADWSPRHLTFRSDFKFEPETYFRERGIKHTLRRLPDKSARYEISRDSLRKGILSELSLAAGESGALVSLKPGPKFRPHDFMRQAFRLREPEDWVRISACCDRGHNALNL